MKNALRSNLLEDTTQSLLLITQKYQNSKIEITDRMIEMYDKIRERLNQRKSGQVIEEEKKEEKNEEKEKNKEEKNSQNNIISLFEDLNNHDEDNDLSEELTSLSLYQQKKSKQYQIILMRVKLIRFQLTSKALQVYLCLKMASNLKKMNEI